MTNAVRCSDPRLAPEARRWRISVRKPVETAANGLNERGVNWPEHCSRMVWKGDTSDAERQGSREVAAIVTTRFAALWDSQTRAITPKMRVFFGDREYDIVGVKEIGFREGVEISASARAETVLP